MQGIRAPRGTDARHAYQLAGLLVCGSCGRRMESCFTNNQPGYRCRRGHTSATARPTGSLRQAYIREDRVLEHLAALLIRFHMSRHHDTPGSPMTELPSPTTGEAIAFLRHNATTRSRRPTTRQLRPCEQTLRNKR
ncbi:zinc ribbon domain-containing protein [Catenulispora pinistramenti]|uniref:zinc ribbon domain-containing protein n=1 Tax=Catenulispora pinistramenti TaxID=2705254 RepID=UPI0039B5B1AB